jgi:uncharacterized FAD-dependent dehydrogenase
MLRLSEIKLPLDHTDAELTEAILKALNVNAEDLLSVKLFKRSYDARKKSQILLIYQLDVELTASAEQSVLAISPSLPRIGPSPDTRYKFAAQAALNFPSGSQQQPIIIGFGPCGILAALVLAQMGLKPIVVERGQEVRQRTQDT